MDKKEKASERKVTKRKTKKGKAPKPFVFDGVFQVNDVVIYNGETCYVAGTERMARGTVIIERQFQGWGRDGSVHADYKEHYDGRYYAVGPKEITFVSRGGATSKKAKAKPEYHKFALQYDLDQDPIEFYYTRKEVDARIRDLVSKKHSNGLKLDSIKVYELVKPRKIVVKESIGITYKK